MAPVICSPASRASPLRPAPICWIKRYAPSVVSGVSIGIIVGAIVASITFVSPQQGSQAIGVQPIEITTTISGVNRVEFYVDGNLVGVARQAPFRILHDFGDSLTGHEIITKIYHDNFHDIESAS